MKKISKIFIMACLIIPCGLMLAACGDNVTTEAVAYDWYDKAAESATTYTISNPTQLVEFGNIISGLDNRAVDTFAGKTIKLANDIDISSIAEWRPIGGNVTYTTTEENPDYTKIDIIIEDAKTFQGTFDGCTHSIKGLKITKKDAKYGAFFVATKDATIQNINFSEVNMCLDESKLLATDKGCDYATVVGIAKNTQLKDITVGGSICSTRVAGIAYVVTDGTKLTNCVSSLALTSNRRTYSKIDNSGTRAVEMNVISGGLVGQVAIENATTIDKKATDEKELFLNCKFNGTLTVENSTGTPSMIWVGQLIGSTSYPSPATNGYYTLVVSGFKAEGKLVVKNSTNLPAQTTFNGVDANDVAVVKNTANDHYDANGKLGRIHKDLGLIVK